MFSSRNTHAVCRVRDAATNELTKYKKKEKKHTEREKREIQQTHKEKATWTYCKLIVQFCSNICYSHPIKVPSRQVAKRWFKAFAFNVYFFMWTIFVPRAYHAGGMATLLLFQTLSTVLYTHTQNLDVIVDNCCSIPKIPMHTHNYNYIYLLLHWIFGVI